MEKVACLAVALSSAISLVTVAHAGERSGYQLSDLCQLDPRLDVVAGDNRTYEAICTPDRLTVACEECREIVGIDIEFLDAEDAGTAERLKTGETTYDDLEKQCQAKAPECTLEAMDIAPATGWKTRWDSLFGPTSTVVVWSEGQLLTLRVMADSIETRDRLMGVAEAEYLTQLLPASPTR